MQRRIVIRRNTPLIAFLDPARILARRHVRDMHTAHIHPWHPLHRGILMPLMPWLQFPSLAPVLRLRYTHHLPIALDLQPRPAVMQMARYKRHLPAQTARDRPLRTAVVEVRVGLGGQARGAAAADVEPHGLRLREARWHAGDEFEGHGDVGGARGVDHVHEFGDEADLFVRGDVVAGFRGAAGFGLVWGVEQIGVNWTGLGWIHVYKDLPANADVDWCPLVSGRKEAIAAVIRTHDSGAVHVREDGMVEPHSAT
jgi:hypothetical protein